APAAGDAADRSLARRRGGGDMTTILLAGGGTGGHVFPLIAIAEQLARWSPTTSLRFVGTARGLEARVIPARGWPLDLLAIEPIKGRAIAGRIRAGAIAARAMVAATSLIRLHRPALVVSIGSYAAGPVSLAAAALGVKVALVEPNRVAGLTQRLLSPLARRIYVGFPEALAGLGDKGRAFGVPLRAGFDPAPLAAAKGRPVRVLVTGGSQGAQAINERMPEVVAALVGERKADVRVLHQAGRGHAEATRARYDHALDRSGNSPLIVEVVEFIDDVPAKLRDCDLLIARAGAMTCAEACAVGRPSVLIPYPFAADDHQAANADALARAGAAIAIRQSDATIDALVAAIAPLVTDPARRLAMADAARARSVPDAASCIARDLLQLAAIPAAREAAAAAPEVA
ncbi:MAG: undecaprenyldiphospho-muramoylpentapeptide beta-N-acetylglucosaminyltransferase, partial [Polyangiales bacterium]